MRATAPETAALEELLEASEALLFARLAPGGSVLAANPALVAHAGRPLEGSSVFELIAAPQRPALERALRTAEARWAQLTLGFPDPGGRAAKDRRVLLRRAGEDVLFVAEPALGENDRLVEQVLELNEDLIAAQRALSRRQRQLERAEAEAAAATDRVRRLESIMLAGLSRPDLQGVLEALLEIACDVLHAQGAAILLRHEDRGELRVAAAIGMDEQAARDLPEPPGDGVAGVPLVLEDETIGVLHVSAPASGRFGEEDRALLERVGERAALAIGHAQLRERERAVAETLQHSMLPERLPEVPGVRLAARYLSRAHGVHVGGDFYDAVRVGGGSLALAIGDVAGKGLQAASAMGRLRNSLRAYAVDGAAPAELLARLDRLVSAEEAMATAQCLLLDPAAGALRFANAGHPPAVRIADGGVGWLEGALGPPLGAGWPGRPEEAVTLAPGERLLLYTDGLVERRDRPLDWGLGRLADTARELAGAPLDELCDGVLAALGAEAGFVDDVALLAVALES